MCYHRRYDKNFSVDKLSICQYYNISPSFSFLIVSSLIANLNYFFFLSFFLFFFPFFFCNSLYTLPSLFSFFFLIPYIFSFTFRFQFFCPIFPSLLIPHRCPLLRQQSFLIQRVWIILHFWTWWKKLQEHLSRSFYARI